MAKTMHSVSVKTALSGLFGLMILIISGFGYISMTQIGVVNDNVEVFARFILPSSDLLGRISSGASDFRYQEAEYLYSETSDERATSEKQLTGTEQRLKDDLETFAKFADQQQSGVLTALSSKWALYLQLHRNVLQLARANNRAEANKRYKGEMAAVHKELDKLIDQMLEWDRQDGKRVAT